MNRLQKIVAPVLVLVLGVGTVIVLDISKPEPEKKNEPPRPLSVFVEPVERTDAPIRINTQGEVRAKTAIDIVAQVGGRIVSVSPEFTEGGVVTPGITLITIENTDYHLALSQAQARVAEAEVKVQQSYANADVARKQLRNQDNASELALRKPQVAEARARLKAAHAELQQAELNLARTKISLPFEGRITSTSVDVGQYVTPGSSLGKAFSTDVVEIRVSITDSQLASLKLPIGYIAPVGEGLDIDVSAMVAGQQQRWQGRLVRLDASIDSTTRMLYGIAEVTEPYGENVSQLGMPLAVGLFVNAEIIGPVVADAFSIARPSLRAGNTVYLINDAGRLVVQDVNVMHSSKERAIISAGLKDGDRVIVSSIRNPIQGMALEAQIHSPVVEPVLADKGRYAGRTLPPNQSGG